MLVPWPMPSRRHRGGDRPLNSCLVDSLPDSSSLICALSFGLSCVPLACNVLLVGSRVEVADGAALCGPQAGRRTLSVLAGPSVPPVAFGAASQPAGLLGPPAAMAGHDCFGSLGSDLAWAVLSKLEARDR